jgi:hypothetical protein
MGHAEKGIYLSTSTAAAQKQAHGKKLSALCVYMAQGTWLGKE